jgi:membrane-bound serine protease (ClpP class)
MNPLFRTFRTEHFKLCQGMKHPLSKHCIGLDKALVQEEVLVSSTLSQALKTKNQWKRRVRMALLVGLCFLGAMGMIIHPASSQVEAGAVYVLHVEGIINPPLANYVERAVNEAIQADAQLVVIMIDTPGGLDTSMREIIQRILSSPVPIAVYVAPSGSRAASAGLFILVASHIAAMAPNTNSGSATPVALGGDMDDAMTAKVVGDAAAYIRTLAEGRGRNSEWPERAVREGVSVTEREALELNVIDLVAANLDDLLAQIDGQTVETITGEITLDLADAPVVEAPMNFAENFVHVISNPEIAFILLSVGSIGLLAELYNPGALFPGVTGAIALILAFFSLGNLPTNWAGVALIVFAIILIVAELMTEGFGVLGVGALVAFVLGAVILYRPFQTPSPALPDLRVDPVVLTVVTVGMGAFMVFVFSQLLKTRTAPISTGKEFYVGQTARVHQTLNPKGRIWFEGQTWWSELKTGQGEVQPGKRVRIVGIDGLTLIVEPLEEETPGDTSIDIP